MSHETYKHVYCFSQSYTMLCWKPRKYFTFVAPLKRHMNKIALHKFCCNMTQEQQVHQLCQSSNHLLTPNEGHLQQKTSSLGSLRQYNTSVFKTDRIAKTFQLWGRELLSIASSPHSIQTRSCQQILLIPFSMTNSQRAAGSHRS